MSHRAFDEYLEKGQEERFCSSPEVIVQLLLQFITPKKVIDIGCGNGYWLAAFQ